jgi:hypothetical protein
MSAMDQRRRVGCSLIAGVSQQQEAQNEPDLPSSPAFMRSACGTERLFPVRLDKPTESQLEFCGSLSTLKRVRNIEPTNIQDVLLGFRQAVQVRSEIGKAGHALTTRAYRSGPAGAAVAIKVRWPVPRAPVLR